jgi:hypothetical protein
MRFINLYLLGYLVLVIGGLLALWQVGVLQHVSGVWVAISSVIVVGLGLMMSVSAGKPAITKE